MAAPMDHHRRKKTCDDRPAYRDGRREKAVKVYTINQESCYLIIQGVPDIKVTEELIKVFSLYGTIEEYRILEDFPAESFTKVYWVKYIELQAARVARRKMDDKPFFGGMLHVSYAPEYESVEDTRRKLQERRKEVARRLRKLQQAEVPSTSDCKPTSTTQDSSSPLAPKSGCQTSPARDADAIKLIGPRKPDPLQTGACVDSHQPVGVPLPRECSEEIPVQLPAPPRTLPIWEWEDPVTSRDQYPRLPTTHATLPRNFNPYPDGYEPNVPGSQQDSNPTPILNTVTNTEGEALMGKDARHSGQTSARPKFTCGRDKPHSEDARDGKTQRPRLRFLDRVAWREGSKHGEVAATEKILQDQSCVESRTHPPSLKRPHPDDHYSKPASRTSGGFLPGPQTSSFVPRQLLGKRKSAESSQPERAGFGLCPDGGARHSEQRRREGTALTQGEPPPVTGDASFDRTVQNVRNQMRNVITAPRQATGVQQQAAPARQLAAAAAPAGAGGPSTTKRPRI